jgi:hypothetical protein
MDGTSRDFKYKGQFTRPLTYDRAIDTYASIVVAMKFSKVKVQPDLSYSGLDMVTISLSNGLVLRKIPYSDYSKMLLAVERLGSQPLFSTYPQGVFEAARVALSVLFSEENING